MSTITGLRIQPDGNVDLVQLDHNDLGPARELIGGWIEITYGQGWLTMYDEDGASKQLPLNGKALLIMDALGAPRPYVGDVIFCGSRGRQPTNVPVRIIDLLKKLDILDPDEFNDYTA